MRRADFRAVDPVRSRIVLIGTPHYRDEHLLDVPVIANNVADLAAVFTDPDLGGFGAENCVTVPPEADLVHVGEALTAAAGEATDLLLVYYSGHGLIDRRGKLYLSLADTRPSQLAYSALAFDSIRETFLDGLADNRAVILDSCFSGRAIGQPLAGGQSLLAALEVSGTFTLTSAAANRIAIVLAGEAHTAFTERLLRLLQKGTTKAGQMLTLADIYRHLRTQLVAEGLPEPQQLGTNAVGLLGLVRNRQVGSARQLLAGSLPELASAAATGRPADPGPTWQIPPGDTVPLEGFAAMAIDQALRITSEADSKQGRRICLSLIAPVVADVDEHEALGLVVTISDPERRESILKDIAVVVAATDYFRAIEIVLPICESYRGEALADIAKLADHLHPGDGEYTLDTYILGAAPHPGWSPETLSTIAGAVAEFAPGRAEEIAAGISDRACRVNAFAGIVGPVAAADANRAMHIVNHLVDSEYRGWVGEGKYPGWMLSVVAQAVACVDPDRALHLISPIVTEKPYPRAVLGIARTIARTDPDLALSISREITHRVERAEALTATARALAVTDFEQALKIIALIGAEQVEEAALADLVPALATSDPARAMRLADSITDRLWQVFALSGIASALLDTRQRQMTAVRLAALH